VPKTISSQPIKSSQITDMSDMRDKTTQDSKLSRQPLKKKKSHSIESILAIDRDKFCPGSKYGNKLQELAPSF